MTIQAINGAVIEIVVIGIDGKTDPNATLDACETATVVAVDAALRASTRFQTAYPQAALVRVESMREVADTDRGRYYLRYHHAGGSAEFWGHAAPYEQIDLKKGAVGIVLPPYSSTGTAN